MVNYNFQPDPKRPGRNQYLGSWTETRCRAIDLPLTKESLISILQFGIDIENSPYTHQEIAHWADSFLGYYDPDNELEDAVTDAALEIDMQWQMYLGNTYTLEELQALDFSKVKLPSEWFSKWLAEMNE